MYIFTVYIYAIAPRNNKKPVLNTPADPSCARSVPDPPLKAAAEPGVSGGCLMAKTAPQRYVV